MKSRAWRLNRFVASSLGISRRSADKLIKDEGVLINGTLSKNSGTRVSPEIDTVKYRNRVLELPPVKYFIMNKPAGYLCSRRSQGGKSTVYDLLPESARKLESAGRLDLGSTGLLLFTNDGILAQKLTHPGFGHEKEYIVEVKYDPKINEAIKKLNLPVKLSDGYIAKASVNLKGKKGENFLLSMTLKTGHKRQVRMMCKKAGLRILSLTRVRIGRLNLPAGLLPGKGRFISKEEAYKATG
ncbi:MAG: rRNA pseudouridine synthase [Candidatus Eremiobacteraeota bacterium]|nr:rRNA pseudouridine synthase [Candidatus Eremiobacteraeota bacterium]